MAENIIDAGEVVPLEGIDPALDGELDQMVDQTAAQAAFLSRLELVYQHYPERNPHNLGKNAVGGVVGAVSPND